MNTDYDHGRSAGLHEAASKAHLLASILDERGIGAAADEVRVFARLLDHNAATITDQIKAVAA